MLYTLGCRSICSWTLPRCYRKNAVCNAGNSYRYICHRVL